MTSPADQYGLGIRQRPVNPARRASAESLERFAARREAADSALAEPFRGITSDGAVLPGLFPLQATGVSTKPILRAALKFLDTLSEAQARDVRFALDSDVWQRWYNIHPYVMRHGLLLEDLSDAQREAALDILRASLSAGGFQTARNVMKLNYTIGEITGSWEEYGDWVYFLSLFGTPSADQPWGWQIDGHHLNLNCLVLGDQLVMTPMFMGSEPVVALTGKYQGTAVLQAEQDQGLELVRSFAPEQQSKAILYPSILSSGLPPERGRGPDGRVKGGAFADNAVVPYEGVRAAGLSAGQRELLLRLASVYTDRIRPGHAELRLAEVERHLDDTYFAWMGGIEDDSVFYYRIHSPVILIEFDHQSGVAFDNQEPRREHIHTVVRTPNGNDYGKDLLRQHYARFHHAGGLHTPRAVGA